MKKDLFHYFLILLVFLVFRQACLAQRSILKHTANSSPRIIWDSASLCKIVTGGYARMIELHSGKLRTVYAVANGNTSARFAIRVIRSYDDGVTWNSITVLKNDTILALTSTHAYSATTEVWMIKGNLMQN